MSDSSSAAVMVAQAEDNTSHLHPGIQFDDEGSSPEERESEATRQRIWEKFVARLRTEFSQTGEIRLEPGEA